MNKMTQPLAVIIQTLVYCLVLLATNNAIAAAPDPTKMKTFSSGTPLTATDLQGNFDEIVTAVTDNDTKINSPLNPGTLKCEQNPRLEIFETGTAPVSYWPSAQERAELLQYGWICWNRLDPTAISPLTTMVHSNDYKDWDDGAGNLNEKNVCGRITKMTLASKSIWVFITPDLYWGLRFLDGRPNVEHGAWADPAQASLGQLSGHDGAGDYWGIYVCR